MAKRDGIVVLDWNSAFERLRDAPRISIVENLLPLYNRHMTPTRLPAVSVITNGKLAA